jgi:hypothetical protein
LFKGTAAVALVGGMAWAAAVVFKKYQEGKMFEQMARGMKIKNDSLEELLRGLRESIDLLLQNEARSLYDKEFGDTTDPEQIARLKLGIKTFMGLIEKGAEIHPALKVPENVKNLFPDFSKLSLIESKIKQIANHEASQDKNT